MLQILIPLVIGGFILFKKEKNEGLKGATNSVDETDDKITFHYFNKISKKEIFNFLKENTEIPDKEIELKVSKTIYNVHHGGDDWADRVIITLDREEAYSELEDLEPENPNSVTEYKALGEYYANIVYDDEYIRNEIKELEDEDLIEVFEYIFDEIELDSFDKDDFEFEDVETNSFDRANDKTDILITEVEEILSKKFKKRVSKYFNLNDYSIRLADHSPNPSRLLDIDISIVISNHDETSKKFRSSYKSTYFDSDTKPQEIVDFILEEIK